MLHNVFEDFVQRLASELNRDFDKNTGRSALVRLKIKQ